MAGNVFYHLDVPELNDKDDWILTIALLGITALFFVAFLWQGLVFLRDLYLEKCGRTVSKETPEHDKVSAVAPSLTIVCSQWRAQAPVSKDDEMAAADHFHRKMSIVAPSPAQTLPRHMAEIPKVDSLNGVMPSSPSTAPVQTPAVLGAIPGVETSALPPLLSPLAKPATLPLSQPTGTALQPKPVLTRMQSTPSSGTSGPPMS